MVAAGRVVQRPVQRARSRRRRWRPRSPPAPPSPGSGRSPGSRRRSAGSTPRCSASQFGDDDADAVLDRRARPRSGSIAPVVKPSISSTLEAGVGDRRPGGVDGERAERLGRRAARSGSARSRRSRPGRGAAKRALIGVLQRERGHGDAAARGPRTRPSTRVADAQRRVGTVEQPADQCAGRPAPRARRRRARTAGRRRSPGRNDWRIDRPRPDDAAPADRHEREVGLGAAAVRADDVGRDARTCRSASTAPSRARARPRPSQYGADRSSGTGTGGRASQSRSRDHPRRPAARRSRPTCSRARAGSPRCARRARARGAARAAARRTAPAPSGSRYDGPPSMSTSPM